MNTASPDDIDISAVWRSLRRALPKLILLSLMTGGIAYATLSTFPPRYTSEAQIQVVAPKDGGDRSFDSVASRLDKEAINTHLRTLMSPDLALQIIAEEKLASNPEFNSALQPPSKLDRLLKALDVGDRNEESEQDRLLKAFFKSLEVYSPKESRVIGIRFTSDDPKLAAAVANRIAETYRTMLATRTLAETDDVQKALQPKIDKLVNGSCRSRSRDRALPRPSQHLQGRPQQHRPQPAATRRHHRRADAGAGRPQRSRRTRPIGARDGKGRQRRSAPRRAALAAHPEPRAAARTRRASALRIVSDAAAGASAHAPAARRSRRSAAPDQERSRQDRRRHRKERLHRRLARSVGAPEPRSDEEAGHRHRR